MTDNVDFTGVESTMLVTLYLKALESRSPDSILADRPAAEAVDRIDYDFASLIPRGGAGNRFMVAMRAKQLDDWTADFLALHPKATVLHLGCGLDTRAFRLTPGNGVRWFDIDLPDVIALRRRVYPQRPEWYRTIASSVTDPAWLEEIPTGRPTLIVAEGLLMYLTAADVTGMLHRFTEHFDTGELICDGFAPLITRTTQRLSRLLARKGYPPYHFAMRDGREIQRGNPRFTLVEQVPVVARFEHIPERAARRKFRFIHSIPATRNLYQLFRFAFRPA